MESTYLIFELDFTLVLTYLCTKFGVNRIGIATSSVHTYTHAHKYIHTTYKKSFQPRDRWRYMTPMLLGLFVNKLQPKVGLAGYDILFAYFVVEAKSKNAIK